MAKFLYSGPTTVVTLAGKPVTLATGEEYEVADDELGALKLRNLLTLVREPEVAQQEVKTTRKPVAKEPTA